MTNKCNFATILSQQNVTISVTFCKALTLPERENFMKLRSSKASVNAGIAMVCLLMPIIPEVVDAKTTYEQQQSTTIETELKQASYTENVSDIVARGYEEANETDMYEGMAIAVVDPYIMFTPVQMRLPRF